MHYCCTHTVVDLGLEGWFVSFHFLEMFEAKRSLKDVLCRDSKAM